MNKITYEDFYNRFKLLISKVIFQDCKEYLYFDSYMNIEGFNKLCYIKDNFNSLNSNVIENSIFILEDSLNNSTIDSELIIDNLVDIIERLFNSIKGD